MVQLWSVGSECIIYDCVCIKVADEKRNTANDTQYHYDVKNEKVLMIFDGMVDGEDNPELIAEIEDSFIEEYIPLPGQYEINEYRIMEEFIYDLPEGRNQDTLERAILGLSLGIVIEFLIDDIGLGMCLGI